MGWVYCDSVSDHTPVSGFCWHFHMFHSLHVRAAFFLSSCSRSTSCWWTLMQDKRLLLKHFPPRRFSKYSKEKLLNLTDQPSRNQLTVGVKGDLCMVVWSKCTCGRPIYTVFCVNAPEGYTTLNLLVKKAHLNIHCLDKRCPSSILDSTEVLIRQCCDWICPSLGIRACQLVAQLVSPMSHQIVTTATTQTSLNFLLSLSRGADHNVLQRCHFISMLLLRWFPSHNNGSGGAF